MKKFYFFVLTNDHLWSLCTFSKKKKLKQIFSNNHERNICRLFHFLAQCCFTAIESELQNCHQDVNLQVSSRVAKQLQKVIKFQENP